MQSSRILPAGYPGKDEILAAWKWGISPEGTPVTSTSEATTAMDLALKAFEERDRAIASIGHMPEEITYLKGHAQRLRAECLRALKERDQAIEAFENAHELCDADLEAQKRSTRAALWAPKAITAVALLLLAIAAVLAVN